jgi:hypothetical protein
MTPRKQPQQAANEQNRIVSPLPEQYAMAPSSNISVLSEDEEFTLSSPSKSRIATPERSIARSQVVHGTEARHSFFLMRVNAPRGLQILDAPQFQVSNLIRGTTPVKNNTSSSRDGSIFSTMATPHTAKSTQKVGNQPFSTRSRNSVSSPEAQSLKQVEEWKRQPHSVLALSNCLTTVVGRLYQAKKNWICSIATTMEEWQMLRRVRQHELTKKLAMQ